jgi:hypothetical protein
MNREQSVKVVVGGMLLSLGVAIATHRHDPPHAEESSQPENRVPVINFKSAPTNTAASAVLMFDLEPGTTGEMSTQRIDV